MARTREPKGRKATMAERAKALGVSRQALGKRLRREREMTTILEKMRLGFEIVSMLGADADEVQRDMRGLPVIEYRKMVALLRNEAPQVA